MEKLKLERWEADEFIITINGNPVGPTVNANVGNNIIEWLKRVNIEDLK